MSSVAEIKDYLIKAKAAKLTGSEAQVEFQQYLPQLLNFLKQDGLSDKERTMVCDTLSIWLLRAHQIKLPSAISAEDSTFIMHHSIDFWNDSCTALSNSLKGLFLKLVQLVRSQRELLASWVSEIVPLPATMKAKYYLLEVLSKDVYIDFSSHVDDSIKLLESRLLGNPVGKCLTAVWKSHYTGDDEKWLAEWSEPVRFALTHVNAKQTMLYVLPGLFEVSEKAFNSFIGTISSKEVLIPCLQIGKELGYNTTGFSKESIVELLTTDEYKLRMFELLTFAKKSSELIDPEVYDLVWDNLEQFFVDQDLQTRSYFNSSFKKFLARIKDSTYALQRDQKKMAEKNKFPEEQEQKLEQIKLASDFVAELVDYLYDNLAPSSAYPRLSLSMKILLSLSEMEWVFELDLYRLDKLIPQLHSNYDDVRQWGLELLTKSKRCLTQDGFEALLNKALQMLDHYTTGDAGAKVLEYLFLTGDSKLILDVLCGGLFEQLDNIDFNKPISGYFTAVNAVLPYIAEVDVDFFYKMITQNWENVFKILTDHTADPTQAGYAFRSVKESTALLTTLLHSDSEISNKTLLDMCELLQQQLSLIRHSGAFQSVYPTFIACCQRCYKDIPEQLPQLLENNLVILKTTSQLYTRRSGGVPFLLAAIVSVDNSLIEKTIDSLIEIINTPVTEVDNKDLAQIHAFNCIKVLFVEKKLTQVVGPYVARALELTLKYFTHPMWTFRNCSMMLFTALQNKLLSNHTSARLFFTKYAGVRELLLESFGNESMESIFLTTSILEKLTPTPGYDGLEAFKPLLVKTLSNKNYKIREISARALSSLYDRVDICLELLDDSSIARQNQLHGHLLAINELVRKLGINKEISSALFAKVDEVLSVPCYVTIKALVSILQIALTNAPNHVVLSKLGNYFIKQEYSIDGSKNLMMALIADILMQHDKDVDLILLGLYSPFYEVVITTLKYAKNIKDTRVEQAMNEIFDNDNTWSYVKAMVLPLLSHVDASRLLPIIEGDYSEDLKASAVEKWTGDVSTVSHFGKDDSPFHLRMAYLKFLCANKHLFHIYLCLYDDDDEIRDSAAQFLAQHMGLTYEPVSYHVSRLCVDLFHSAEYEQKIADAIITYIPLAFKKPTAEEVLFSAEKDNQYRSATMLLSQLLDMLVSVPSSLSAHTTSASLRFQEVMTSGEDLQSMLDNADFNDDTLCLGKLVKFVKESGIPQSA